MINLLYEAAMHLANLSNPGSLANSEAALEEVRKFIAVEERVLATSGAQEELEHFIMEPLDATGNTQNHAMMAGLILARSGWPGAPAALLAAAQHSDDWCAVQARLNLSWLTPGEETTALLQTEIQSAKGKRSRGIPVIVLVEALIHQRAEDTRPTIISYIEGEDNEPNRAAVLTSLVNLWPEEGLQVAENLAKRKPGILSLTALGLQAVYANREAYDALLQYPLTDDNLSATVLRWLGRIPCPESLKPLLHGLNHPSTVVKCDVVTSLGLLGLREAYQAVVQGLFDSGKEVSDQAMSLLFHWFGDDLTSLTQQWSFDSQGRLDAASSQKLKELIEKRLNQLKPGLRYMGKAPALPVYNLEYLYLGLLPDHYWYHWVSTTGSYQAYDTQKSVLYNFPSLEKVETWHLGHQADFSPGGFYYHGQPCG